MLGPVQNNALTPKFGVKLPFWVVYFSRFASTAALYVVLPFAVVVYPDIAHITPATAALLTGSAIVLGRLLALPAGKLIDHHGSKAILVITLAIITCAGFVFYIMPSRITIALQILSLSIGTPICNIAYRVIIANSVVKEHQSTAFGFLASSNNIGIVVAPLISSTLLSLGKLPETGIASAILSLTSLVILVTATLPLWETAQIMNDNVETKQSVANPSISAVQYFGMLTNVALSWAFLQAIIVSLAQYSELNFHTIIPASVFFAVQAATVIPLLPIAGRSIRSISLRCKLALFHTGTLIVPLAMVGFAMFQPTYGIIAAIFLALLITVSEALCMPSLDTLIASTTAASSQGRAFGSMVTAQAIGMGIGTGLSVLLVSSPSSYFSSSSSLLVIGICGSALVLLGGLTMLKSE